MSLTKNLYVDHLKKLRVIISLLTEPKNLQEELLRDCGHHEVPVRRKAVKGLGRYHNDNAAIESIAKVGR